MTSDTTGPADSTTPAAPAKPPRRRATRKTAAPAHAAVEAGTTTDAGTGPATPQSPSPQSPSPETAPAQSAPAQSAPAQSAPPSTTPDAPATTAPPAEAAATEAPSEPATRAPRTRATRSRRASAPAAEADTATTTTPKRTTRSRAKATPPPVEVDPDAAASPASAPVLDVLAELARAQTAAAAPAPDPTPEPAVEPVAAEGPTDEAPTDVLADETPADETPADEARADEVPTAEAAPDADLAREPRTDTPPAADAAPDDATPPSGGGTRLATTAVLFQAPDPTAARPRRRRVVAPAGPPQLIVPEVVSPEPVADQRAGGQSTATDAPPAAPAQQATAVASEPAAEPAAEPAGEPRRRSRRATRSTAAPVAVDPAASSVEPGDSAAPADLVLPRRPSRRRGSRGSGTVIEPAPESVVTGATADADATGDTTTDSTSLDSTSLDSTDLDSTDLDGTVLDVAAELAALQPAGTEPADDEDEDDTPEGGAPRRRRRRGGRGRRNRAGGDADAGRPADDVADDDEDEEEDAPTEGAADVDEPGEVDDADDTDEGTGSSRRRRRRRRSGRGTDTAEPDAEPVRTRAARPVSDEVTALRGSTRLEAKRQRRREGRDAGRRRQIITESEFLARRESVDRTMVVRELDGRTQIAVLEDGVLVEHYVSRQAQVSMAGNVYLGRVQNVLPSMEAAFVDVGKGRNAVLYAGEVNWDAAGLEGQPRRIEQALKSGDSVLVQVTKDPMGHKGARLTSQITLAGRYLVYVPGGGMTGISRKLPDTERSRLKKLLREIVPDSAGVIVRTAAEGASEEELRADIQRLQDQWTAIEKKAKTASAPALLQGEPDLAIRVVRDIFNDDFGSLVVQGDEAWDTISGYIGALAPDLAAKVTRWTTDGDVFAAHRIDEQLAKGMDRKVWLPSGGSLVIDRTEAMTVVDVNTGKFTGSGGTLEETVTRNNLEAAEEIVRQLRLRDIGGIIVIDFIDMVLEINRDLVLRRLVECLGRDRTKHQVAEVTSLGLVQMTRKRVGQGLVEAFSETCETCNGRGFIVHTEPLERGGPSAPAPVSSAPAPAGSAAGTAGAAGEDPKRARRRRGGKEQGAAVPSGLPMVPVLPQAREAVKATLATIAAAAAHAHEHEHHAREPQQPAAVAVAEPAGGDLGGAGGGDGQRPDGDRTDATVAVTEALEALRSAHGPEHVPADVTPTTEQVLAVQDVEQEALADTDLTAGIPDAELVPDAAGVELQLVPVAPEVFALADGEPDASPDAEPDAEPVATPDAEPDASSDGGAAAGAGPEPLVGGDAPLPADAGDPDGGADEAPPA